MQVADRVSHRAVTEMRNGVRLQARGRHFQALPVKERVVKFERVNLRAEQEEEVREEGARRLRDIVSDYSEEERETWSQQVAEAEAYQLNPLTPVPFIEALAARRLETVAELVQIILTKTAAYRLAAATILSAQSALLQMAEIPSDFRDDSYWT